MGGTHLALSLRPCDGAQGASPGIPGTSVPLAVALAEPKGMKIAAIDGKKALAFPAVSSASSA